MSECKEHTALIGYSGHSFVVAEAALLNSIQLVGYFELEKKEINPYGLDFLGTETDLVSPVESGFTKILMGIGDNFIRSKSAALLRIKGFKVCSIVHKESFVSSSAVIKSGTFVARGAIINPIAEIGEDCIVNSGVIIEHGVTVGNGSHIAPAAVVCGDVSIGKMCFIGAGAVLKQGIRIGSGAIIGGGAVVVKDVPQGEKWFGVPAVKRA